MKRIRLIVLTIMFSLLFVSCSNKISKIEVEEALRNSQIKEAVYIAHDFNILEQETLEENVYSVKIEFVSQSGRLKEYNLIVNTMEKPLIETYDY